MQETLIDKFLFIVPTTISDHFDEIKQLKNISIEKTIETSFWILLFWIILNFFERNKCTVSRDSMVHICTLLTRHDDTDVKLKINPEMYIYVEKIRVVYCIYVERN